MDRKIINEILVLIDKCKKEFENTEPCIFIEYEEKRKKCSKNIWEYFSNENIWINFNSDSDIANESMQKKNTEFPTEDLSGLNELREEEEYQYQKNCNQIINFFQTNEYKAIKKYFFNKKFEIRNEKYSNKLIYNSIFTYMVIRCINNGWFKEKGSKEKIYIYRDPDANDGNLYNTIVKSNNSTLWNGKGLYYKTDEDKYFRCSLDGIIAWKPILQICYNEASVKNTSFEEKFLNLYKDVRNPRNAGHLIWPTHALPTINTEKYQKCGDRIDYTLKDIKNYYECKKIIAEALKDKVMPSVLMAGALVSNTRIWLDSFDNFKSFIEKMNLKRWCALDEGEVNVIELNSIEKDGYKIIEDNEKKEYVVDDIYIRNVIDIIKKEKDEYFNQ